MGVDFHAVFSHAFDDSTILSVPDLLNADQKLADTLVRHEFYVQEIKPWYWSRGWSTINNEADSPLQAQDVWGNNSHYINVRHGTYWSIRFSRQTCLVHFPKHWHRFVRDKFQELPLREVCYELARIFNSSRAIYTPDSSYSTGIHKRI